MRSAWPSWTYIALSRSTLRVRIKLTGSVCWATFNSLQDLDTIQCVKLCVQVNTGQDKVISAVYVSVCM